MHYFSDGYFEQQKELDLKISSLIEGLSPEDKDFILWLRWRGDGRNPMEAMGMVAAPGGTPPWTNFQKRYADLLNRMLTNDKDRRSAFSGMFNQG